MKTLEQTRVDALNDSTVKKILAAVDMIGKVSRDELETFLVLAYQAGEITGFRDALDEARAMVGGTA